MRLRAHLEQRLRSAHHSQRSGRPLETQGHFLRSVQHRTRTLADNPLVEAFEAWPTLSILRGTVDGTRRRRSSARRACAFAWRLRGRTRSRTCNTKSSRPTAVRQRCRSRPDAIEAQNSASIQPCSTRRPGRRRGVRRANGTGSQPITSARSRTC